MWSGTTFQRENVKKSRRSLEFTHGGTTLAAKKELTRAPKGSISKHADATSSNAMAMVPNSAAFAP